MNEQADILIENLEKKEKLKEKFDICPFISNCTLDIICGYVARLLNLKKIKF